MDTFIASLLIWLAIVYIWGKPSKEKEVEEVPPPETDPLEGLLCDCGKPSKYISGRCGECDEVF